MSKRTTAYIQWYKPVQATFALLAALVSAVGLFAPSLAVAEPAITAITASQITSTSAVITWQTNIASDSFVSYVGAGDEEAAYESSDEMVTSHSISLTGLKPATVYSFTVNSADAEGENIAVNGTDFTTLANGGAPTPPPAPTPTPPPPVDDGSGDGDDDSSGGLQYEEPPVTAPIYPTGTLAKEGGVIYFLMGRDAVKIPFTSMSVFTALGYKMAQVQELDLSSFRLPATSYNLSDPAQQHPWGSILEYKGTLYYSLETGMAGIPSMDIFSANGFEPWMIQTMNAADRAVIENAPAQPVLEEHDSRLL